VSPCPKPGTPEFIRGDEYAPSPPIQPVGPSHVHPHHVHHVLRILVDPKVTH